MAFDITFLIAAFAGGAFGAAISGLFSFILTGLLAIVGMALVLTTQDASFLNTIAYGPVFGPAISFGGAVAASAYAKQKGKLANGQDIATPLISLNSPDVLLVGGIFGAIGYVILWAVSQVPAIGGNAWTNTTALTVMISAIIVRLVFGKTGVFGKVAPGANRWRASETAAWVPWQSDPMQLLVVGLTFATTVSWTIKMVPALSGVWFGISAFALILLQFGMKAPVWHHIVLSAETAVAFSGGDMWWGVAFGVLGAFLGEFMGMLFQAHGDTHIDPPACTLWVTMLLTVILKAAGVFTAVTGVGSIIVAVLVAAGGYAVIAAMKAKPHAKVAAGARA